MYGHVDFLHGLYKARSNTPVINMLRDFGGHLFIDQTAQSLDHYNHEQIHSQQLFEQIMQHTCEDVISGVTTHTSCDISHAVRTRNILQTEQCDDIIKYPDHDNFYWNGKRYQSQTIERLMDRPDEHDVSKSTHYDYDMLESNIVFPSQTDKRSLILYYRLFVQQPTYGKHSYVSVDLFQLCVMLYVARYMIEKRMLLTINDVGVVPRHRDTVPLFINDLFPGVVVNKFGDDFLNLTCGFAHTVHFFGGQIPDGFSRTTPIICDAIKLAQPGYSRMFDHVHLPFCYIPGIVFSNGSYVPIGYDNDCEINSDSGPKAYCDIVDLLHAAKNTDVNNVVRLFVESLLRIDQINIEKIEDG